MLEADRIVALENYEYIYSHYDSPMDLRLVDKKIAQKNFDCYMPIWHLMFPRGPGLCTDSENLMCLKLYLIESEHYHDNK